MTQAAAHRPVRSEPRVRLAWRRLAAIGVCLAFWGAVATACSGGL